MLILSPQHWDLFLRGAVAGLLLHHVVHLLCPGPRPAARLALAAFALSVLAYLFCQQAQVLLNLPRPLAWLLLAGCVSSPAWMWAASRALFDDGFTFVGWVAAALLAMLVLGLAANLPYFPAGEGPYLNHAPGSTVVRVGHLHALASLGFTAAALWEVAHGWRDDLVASRRAVRRWVALGIVLYSAVALVIDLALRGVAVGPLLPALHVAGIGLVALALSVVVARGSLADVLGPAARAEPAPAATAPTTATAAGTGPAARAAEALARLDEAMVRQHAYRREGLTLADLAGTLGMAEGALRELINQRLGFRNFNDFLHHHRLQEAAARLVTEDLPILTVALECGYGSIGPFNRAFKQRLGMTPTEYRVAGRLNRSSA
ncbi:MAG: helix-turn-helix transcriptional regulator [Ideonella sp.]|jgi:AraC-like DNA-binding protein|nr:helix-turn-helix transcriptional regulator [Ideonella sp.]